MNFIKEHGFWGVFFILYCLLVGYLNFGGLMSEYRPTEFSLAIGWLLTFFFIFLGGYFYSLGWKKKLYSKLESNVIFGYLITYLVSTCLWSVYVSLPQMMAQLRINAGEDAPDDTIRLNAILIALVFYVLLYIVLNLPLIFAFFQYKNRSEELQEVKKPYWKLFLTYFGAIFILNAVYLLIYSDKTQLNGWDYPLILSNIIDAALLIGYAYNLKLGKQIIWKIMALPYFIFTVAGVFFLASDHLSELSRLNLVTESIVTLVAESICCTIFMYIYYRYAFTQDVYEEEIVKIENNED